MELALYFSVFLFMSTLSLIIYSLFFSYKRKTKDRLKMIETSYEAYKGNDEYEAEDENGNKRVEKKKLFNGYYEKKRKKLLQAYVLMKPQEFFLSSLLTGALLFLLMFIMTDLVPMALLTGLIGFMIPDALLGSAIKKRSLKLNAQLPEALNNISNGLRAGLSFSQAVSIAGKDMESPIGEELTKIIRDNTLGKTMEQALEDFSKRTDDEDVDMFVTAMIIQRQVGGNLSEVLDTISNTIRERVKLKGEVRTLTAQSRFSAIIISFLPIGIALVLSIMNPTYIAQLFNNAIGLLMVGAAVVMMLIGIFLLTRMVKLDV